MKKWTNFQVRIIVKAAFLNCEVEYVAYVAWPSSVILDYERLYSRLTFTSLRINLILRTLLVNIIRRFYRIEWKKIKKDHGADCRLVYIKSNI